MYILCILTQGGFLSDPWKFVFWPIPSVGWPEHPSHVGLGFFLGRDLKLQLFIALSVSCSVIAKKTATHKNVLLCPSGCPAFLCPLAVFRDVMDKYWTKSENFTDIYLIRDGHEWTNHILTITKLLLGCPFDFKDRYLLISSTFPELLNEQEINLSLWIIFSSYHILAFKLIKEINLLECKLGRKSVFPKYTIFAHSWKKPRRNAMQKWALLL